MKPRDPNQGNLFAWADSLPTAEVVDACPILLHRALTGLITYETRSRAGDIIDFATGRVISTEAEPDISPDLEIIPEVGALVAFPLGRRIGRAQDVAWKARRKKSASDQTRYLNQVRQNLEQQLARTGFSEQVIAREVGDFFELVSREAATMECALDQMAAIFAAREAEDDR